MMQQFIRRSFMMLGLTFLALGALGVAFPSHIQLGLFVIGALLIGLPHGAMDFDIAQSVGLVRSTLSAALFLAGYLLIAGVNFYLWLIFPLSALAFFLLLTVWHFGTDWAEHEWAIAKTVVFGGAFLALPSVLHGPDVLRIFDTLLNKTSSAPVVAFLQLAAPALGLLAAGFIIYDVLKNRIEAALQKAIFIWCAVLLPPILFLFLYFCILHGPQHTHHVYTQLGYASFKHMLRKQLPVLGLTLLLLLGVYYYYEALLGLEGAVFSAIIILTACLTTPHMLLIEYHRLDGFRK